MRIAICDDEKICRVELYEIITEFYKNDRQLTIHLYHNGEALLLAMKDSEVYDLIFLDIYMEGRNGMEIAKEIYKNNKKVSYIFITSTMDFALEGYEVGAKGYLLKPLDSTKVRKILSQVNLEPEQLLFVKSNQVMQRIPYADILYIESKAHKVVINLVDGTEYACWEKLVNIKERLKSNQFLQCHQSYIVNMKQIVKAEEDFVLKNQKVIPIKVKERKKIKEYFYEYMIEEK